MAIKRIYATSKNIKLFRTTPIYTLTLIRQEEPARTRCVGFFHEKKSALDVVYTDLYDLSDSAYYKYLVIEQVDVGIYRGFRNDATPIWFEIQPDLNWEKITPKIDPRLMGLTPIG